MNIDEEGLPQSREVAGRVEQMEKQLDRVEEDFKVLEDKLREAEKDLHRDPFLPEG
jgi:hypothetical protein